MFNRIKIKMIFSFLFIITICINNLNIFAISIDKKYVGKYRVYCNIDSEHYIKYQGRTQLNYEYYYLNEKNESVPAYCLNLGVDGPETLNEYYVNVDKALNDKIAVNILMNGYPYKSVEELGVSNYIQAKYCTQFALWAYLSNLNVEEITPTKPEYDNVVSAIKNIYYNGIKGEIDLNNFLKINAEEFKIYDKDKNYYIANIILDYNSNIINKGVDISGIDSYKIIDNAGAVINSEMLNELKEFSILVPRESIKNDTNVKINIYYKTKQTVILAGVADKDGMQGLALHLGVTIDEKVKKELNIKYEPQKLVIKKVDKDNNDIVLANVKFKLYDEKGNVLGEYVTNKDGIISIDYLKELSLKDGNKVVIEEIEVPNNYYIDTSNNKKEITLKYDSKNEVIFENEKIYGIVEILKKSADYNPYTNTKKDTSLEECEFEIYDENMKLVEKIITNKDGKAQSKELEKGKYYLKEIKASEYYILDDKIYEINIDKVKDIENLTIYNKSMEKELPKTGY